MSYSRLESQSKDSPLTIAMVGQTVVVVMTVLVMALGPIKNVVPPRTMVVVEVEVPLAVPLSGAGAGVTRAGSPSGVVVCGGSGVVVPGAVPMDLVVGGANVVMLDVVLLSGTARAKRYSAEARPARPATSREAETCILMIWY